MFISFLVCVCVGFSQTMDQPVNTHEVTNIPSGQLIVLIGHLINP